MPSRWLMEIQEYMTESDSSDVSVPQIVLFLWASELPTQSIPLAISIYLLQLLRPALFCKQVSSISPCCQSHCGSCQIAHTAKSSDQRGEGIKEKKLIIQRPEPEAGYTEVKNLGFRIRRLGLKSQFPHLTVCEIVGKLFHLSKLPFPVSVKMGIITVPMSHAVGRNYWNKAGKDLPIELVNISCDSED